MFMKKNLVLLLLCIFSLAMFAQQHPNDKKKEELTYLVERNEKGVCLIMLNKKGFVATMSDVQLIDKKIVTDIKMFTPGNDTFNLYMKSYKQDFSNVIAVFEITTVKNAILPDKFKQKKNKQ